MLPYGAVLPFYEENCHPLAGPAHSRAGRRNNAPDLERADLIEFYLHPFWAHPTSAGGRTPWGVDCSGLTQMLFILMGICLPRDADQQVLEGEAVELLDVCEPGDLAFFTNQAGKVVHVGSS
ncbi:MAG: NlpC/P60 family protein [Flavobacteriales bacterium]